MLSIVLQSSKLELSKAYSHVIDVIDVIGNIRENSVSEFEKYFKNASDKSALIGEKIRIPRLYGRQTTRSYIDTRSPIKWYKINIFLPFIDYLISQLNIRFNEKLSEVIPSEGFIPSNTDKYDEEDLVKTAMVYFKDWLDQEIDIKPEISIWKAKWQKEKYIKPDTVMEALKHCDEFFPMI
jgi:hypothetical protein|uniref:Uncharacterized protein n=1 Tax=Sipha flava TaxID=143950 RepID=A0A2S2QFI6_9HEMI